MNLSTLEDFLTRLRKRPKTVGGSILVLVILYLSTMAATGYFGEKGRQLAADSRVSPEAANTTKDPVPPGFSHRSEILLNKRRPERVEIGDCELIPCFGFELGKEETRRQVRGHLFELYGAGFAGVPRDGELRFGFPFNGAVLVGVGVAVRDSKGRGWTRYRMWMPTIEGHRAQFIYPSADLLVIVRDDSANSMIWDIAIYTGEARPISEALRAAQAKNH